MDMGRATWGGGKNFDVNGIGFHAVFSLFFSSGCYSPHGAYAQSKLALVLFAYHLQGLLSAQGSHVTANVVDPGVVNTNLYKHVFWGTRLVKKIFGWWFFKVSLRRFVRRL